MRAGARDVAALGFASAAVLLAAADTYVVVLALTAIMADIGIDIDRLQQAAPIISGFLLGYVVVLPLLGRLSDLAGRRPVLLGCLSVFAIGSAVTASATSLSVVVVGRTLQGLGGGGLVPVTLALVADRWPAGARGVPLGVVGAVQELGSVLGPLYGAGLVALSGWRAIFCVNLPIAAVLGVGFATVAPRGARGGRPDLVGSALAAVCLVGSLLALAEPAWLVDSITWGQLDVPLLGSARLSTPLALVAAGAGILALGWWWAAPCGTRPLVAVRSLPALLTAVDWPGAVLLGGILACVIVAFAAADPGSQVVASNAVVTLPLAGLLAATLAWRELTCRSPLVDLRALRPRPAWGALATNLAVGAALMAALVDVPIFARATTSSSQLDAALELVRLLVAVPVGAVLGGALCERLSYRGVAAAGMLLSAGMFVLMGRWGSGTLAEHGVVLGMRLPLGGGDLALLLCGLGFGLAIAPVNAAILGAVRGDMHGLASALAVVARTVGMLAGLSVLTAVGLRQFDAASTGIPSPIVLCPTSPAACPAYDAQVTAAVLDELHTIFVGAAIAALVAAVLAAVALTRPARGRRDPRAQVASVPPAAAPLSGSVASP